MKKRYALFPVMMLFFLVNYSFCEQTYKIVSTGSYSYPAWSSGDKVAFSANINGDFPYICISNSDGSGFSQLSNIVILSSGFSPALYWTSDGSKIYYLGIPNDDLYSIWRINSNGSGNEMIYQTTAQYSIPVFRLSPNDSKVIFVLRDLTYSTRSLWVMNNDGSSKIQLTNVQSPFSFNDFLVWSSNSNTICYQTSSGYWRKINIDNTGDTIFNIPQGVFYLDWSPIGNTIAYIKNNDIYVLKENGIDTARLTFSNNVFSMFIKYSPDGTKILHNDIYSGPIYVMNADGTNTTTLDSGIFPSWSPNNSKVVYTDIQNLYTINANGTNKSKITNNTLPSSCIVYNWSGDSTRFLYGQAMYLWPSVIYEYYIVNKDGTNKTSFPGVNAKCWTPHPSVILYVPSPTSLWSIRDDGTNTKVLYISSHNPGVSDPVWSPDLSKIIFSDSGEIWIMNSDGSNTVNLTNTPDSQEYSPAWSSNGDSIFYIKGGGTSPYYDIWAMNLDGSGQINLTNTGFSGITTSFALSPDGNKIAFGASGGWYIMNKDGTGMTKISNCPYTSGPPPCWKNNSSLYILTSYGANFFYISTVNSDGTNPQKFCLYTAGGIGEKFAVLSQDGNRVFYYKGTNVYVTDFSTTSVTPPTEQGILKPINNVFDPTKGEKTTIEYKVPTSGRVTIKLYTSDGVFIKTLVDREVTGGVTYSEEWYGKNLNEEIVASGIYLVHIEAPGFSQTKKICVIK